MAKINPVRILNYSMEETPSGDILVRGVVDPACIGAEFLKTDYYQREFLKSTSGSRRTKIEIAVSKGKIIPDIELAARGSNVEFDDKKNVAIIHNPVFIVDGFQRVSAFRAFMETNPGAELPTRLGAKVQFNSTADSEDIRFETENPGRTPVSANILLRNAALRKGGNKALPVMYPGLALLHGLSLNEPDFPLQHRVQWDQRMKRTELVTALMLCKTIVALHRKYCIARGTGLLSSQKTAATTMEAIILKIGLRAFRNNVIQFFSMVDECWGIRDIEYHNSAVHLRGNWLITIAMLQKDHQNFRDKSDKLLFVDADWKRKFKSLPIDDQNVKQLASAGGMAISILYNTLKTELGKGRRTNKLEQRHDLSSPPGK